MYGVDVQRWYEQYGTRCYQLAFAITRDRQFAEDAVQEAFAAAWKHRDRFDPARSTPSTWLMTLTHHKAVDLVRREQSRSTRHDCDDLLAHIPETGPEPEHASLIAAEQRRIRAAVSALAPRYRQVLAMAYFGGYTQTEIATAINVPLGTVKSRTYVALKHLRQVLTDPADGPPDALTPQPRFDTADQKSGGRR